MFWVCERQSSAWRCYITVAVFIAKTEIGTTWLIAWFGVQAIMWVYELLSCMVLTSTYSNSPSYFIFLLLFVCVNINNCYFELLLGVDPQRMTTSRQICHKSFKWLRKLARCNFKICGTFYLLYILMFVSINDIRIRATIYFKCVYPILVQGEYLIPYHSNMLRGWSNFLYVFIYLPFDLNMKHQWYKKITIALEDASMKYNDNTPLAFRTVENM